MKIKVIYNNSTERVLTFAKGMDNVILANYNQEVSQGNILDFEVVA